MATNRKKITLKNKDMNIQEAAKEYADGIRRVDKKNTYDNIEVDSSRMVAFKQGAEWHARQPLWISVEERLPDYLEKVLVLYEYKGEIQIQQNSYLGEKDWKFGSNKILAWMPIPSFDEILEANRDVLERIKEKGD